MTSAVESAPAATRRLDVIGAWLGFALTMWVLVTAIAGRTNPAPMLATLLLTAAALVLARGTAARGRPVGPAAVVSLGGAAILLGAGGLTTAAGAPLLYDNANAAFFLLTAVGGLMMTATWRAPAARTTGIVATALFGVLALWTGSRATLFLVPALAIAALVAWRPGVAVRVVTGLSALAVAAAVVSTVIVAGGGVPRGARREVSGGIGAGRVRLWSEALAVLEERPVLGVGPGGFETGSRTARTDRDIRWAHNEFLQQGAETGLPGLVLLVLMFAWGFARLWASPPDPATGLAAAALGLIGVHASFDYILHFPVIPVALATLAGTAHASRGRRPEEGGAGSLVRKALKAAVLPLGARKRRRPGDVAVLLYHRVGRGRREVDLDEDVFEEQVAALASRGDVVPLDAALAGDDGGTVITVDDGYRDLHRYVLPVLVRHRLPAVLYLATGLVVEEGGPPDGLTWDHLREAVASGLVTVGSHTHSHANLGNASAAEVESELRRSKELIEDRLGVPCRHFAYPWGVGSSQADGLVRRMFDSAALAWGTNRVGSFDRYRLARVPILRSDGPSLFRAKVEGRLDAEAHLYRLLGRGPWRRR